MNLLFLNHNLREHGTFFRAFHFAREAARLGHRATLLTASPGHWYRPLREHLDGVEIIETPSWNPWFSRDDGYGPLDVLWRMAFMGRRAGAFEALYVFAHPPNVLAPQWLFRLLRPRARVAVDWCDLYGGAGGIVALRRALLRRHPEYAPRSVLARMAQRLAWRTEAWAERRIIRRAPRVTVISQFLERRARAMGVAPGRLLRVPSGAPIEAIRPLDKAECRAQLAQIQGNAFDTGGGGNSEGGPVILTYIANYHPDEEYFLDALAHARRVLASAEEETGTDAENGAKFRLFVVAPPFSREALEGRGLADIVIQPGRRPFTEIPLWLGAADALLLPYPDTRFNRSRWPNKFGDYLAAGRPIITNRTADFRPWIDAHDIGLGAESTPESYGNAIAKAVRERERWAGWSAEARALAEGPLSWERLARQLLDFWLG